MIINISAVKWAGIGVICLFVIFWVIGHKDTEKAVAAQTAGQEGESAIVHATNDENLRFLTAKINELTDQNKQILADNENLKDRLAHESAPPSTLNQDKLQTLVDNQQAQIQDLTDQISTIKQKPGAMDDYAVSSPAEQTKTNSNQLITTISDMSLPRNDKGEVIDETHDVTLRSHFNDIDHQSRSDEQASKPIPYFTVPANVTLADVVLLSDIIGEVPVNNTLLQPAFKFKAIVGRKDLLASNGLTLPEDLSGIVFEGYSVGNMSMSCARGYITKMLFTWKDKSFTVVGEDNQGTSLNPQDALGYISTPYGNPCIVGKYITDAPKVIASIAAMGGLDAAGSAFAQAQTTTTVGPLNNFHEVTGNALKYMEGKTVSGGASKALDWYTSRINDVFDVVYVPASAKSEPTRIVVNITKTIPIDKDINGRKLSYEQGSVAAHQLD